MNSLLTIDLILVLVVVGFMIITVLFAVLERPPPSRYYQSVVQAEDALPTDPIQL